MDSKVQRPYPVDKPTYYRLLREHGYRTAGFVARRELNRSRNLHQGFQRYEDAGDPNELVNRAQDPLQGKALRSALRPREDEPRPEPPEAEVTPEMLEQLNFQIKDLGLSEVRAREVLDDATVVFVLGPTETLAPEELEGRIENSRPRPIGFADLRRRCRPDPRIRGMRLYM